jgi:hypothetical protein
MRDEERNEGHGQNRRDIMKFTSFAAILDEAYAAGAAAGAAAIPQPMIVSQLSDPTNDNSPPVRQYYVPEGPCGFGWVTIKGNTAFGRWAKANKHAGSAYPSGLQFWSKLVTQSVTRNAAWASAVAQVLNKHGIQAYAHSRLD